MFLSSPEGDQDMPGALGDRASEAQVDDSLEAQVDEAIAECGGDLRETIRALVIACRYLEEARDRAVNLVSRGYVRGRLDPG
jgi:phosphate uptake regulator